MMTKIYLSHDEVEQLIFKKMLWISTQRLGIKRAQGLYSVALMADEQDLHCNNDTVIVFMSSVHKFEIAEADKNLFLNHYHLPLGLLLLKKRKVRDLAENSLGPQSTTHINNIELSDKINRYAAIRRAFIKLFHVAINSQISESCLATKYITYLNAFENLSKFQYKLIFAVLNHKKLPEEIVSIKDKSFSSTSFYQWVWWGKFLVDNLLNEGLNEMQLAEHKSWLKHFDPDSFKGIDSVVLNVPFKFEQDFPIILGYYLAINNNLDLTEDNHDSTKSKLKKLNAEYNEEIFFWKHFFQSFFVDQIDYVYPIQNIQYEFYKMEMNAYKVIFGKNDLDERVGLHPISLPENSLDTFVKSYHALKDGIDDNEVNIASMEQIHEVFNKSVLFGDNRKNVGFIFNQPTLKTFLANYIQINDDSFTLHQSNQVEQVVYYENQVTSLPIKVKKKPIHSIINPDKRVLFGVITGENFNALIDMYAYILENSVNHDISEILFIWLVDKEKSELHSAAFEQEKNVLNMRLDVLFNQKVKIFTKNVNNHNDSEIIRVIKHIVGEYKLKEIEVIDTDFGIEQAHWLVESTYDHTLVDDAMDYSVLSLGS
ncbi:hypothetical protein FGD67_21190 [Colwellia sp. M166]|uniref:hypothetical protein n=1 Tax=Colwellia sp. M166 TaxID=2583805 RepID=UPI00211DB1E6|nr:hypothetical protein [Colwellia sp. M166]UUO25449.1 hypothetical protein FGD67_21190 [Colwellia sp. M166]